MEAVGVQERLVGHVHERALMHSVNASSKDGRVRRCPFRVSHRPPGPILSSKVANMHVKALPANVEALPLAALDDIRLLGSRVTQHEGRSSSLKREGHTPANQ